jgi:hypothetical protein
MWALNQTLKVKVKVKVILRLTVSRPVRLGVRHPAGTRDQFFPSSLWLFLDICGFVEVRFPIWREAVSVVFSFFRASLAQSFSDLSPTRLMSIFYYLEGQVPAFISPGNTVAQTQEEVEVKLRPTVSRPVRLGVRHPSGTRDQFFFLLEIFFRQLRVCYFVVPGSVIYCCCWSSPAQFRSSLSPAGHKTLFYCPNLATARTVLETYPLLLYPVDEMFSVGTSIILVSYCCDVTISCLAAPVIYFFNPIFYLQAVVIH